MTERPLSITTQSGTSQNAIFHSPINDAPLVTESIDDEPYTIKCICDYTDDDGNTIYCEKCDTWQHIECFYPGRVDDASREEFDHSCADCKPRSLDRRQATERQRNQRQNKSANNFGDKKIKRLPSKNYKKKSKSLELQTNGTDDQDIHKNGILENLQFIKKPKINRNTLPNNALNKKSPPHSSRPDTNAKSPSPTQSPPDLPINFQVHGYSENFLTLYSQSCVQQTYTNSFASLSVSNAMTNWLRDQSRLYQDAGVRDKEDVFLNLKVSVDTLKWPELRIEKKEDSYHDTILHWQYLITPRQLPQPGRIVELNGLVGFQKDYCNDSENRWTESAHPRPFVFFHPRLPLCIDTRQEGSIGRYVRRSCRSNTSLETFIANGTEYHFWLTSEQPLAANEQITISWDFRFPPQYRTRFLHLLNLGDDDSSPFDASEITQEEYEQLTQTIHLVLSDHGGCACDLGKDCAFARFHRNYLRSSHFQLSEGRSKRVRRSKIPHNSPLSNENTASSRAMSESQLEQPEKDDPRSMSGSTRGKSHSRDLTPANTNGDVNCILTEPSDREKRKLAMLEDSFRKMEQGQPPRKKKRASDGTSNNLSPSNSVPKPRHRSIAASGSLTVQTSVSSNNHPRTRPLDATTIKQLVTPTGVLSPVENLPPHSRSVSQLDSVTGQHPKFPPSPRPLFKDASTQTDQIKNAWWTESKLKKRKTIVSLARRLLLNRYRKDREKSPKDIESSNPTDNSSMVTIIPQPEIDDQKQEIDSCAIPSAPYKEISLAAEPSISSDTETVGLPLSTVRSKPTDPLVWPNQMSSTLFNPGSILVDSGLNTQVPIVTSILSSPYPNETSSDTTSVTVINGGTNSTSYNMNYISQSVVNGNFQQQSPLKATKKLSLSDYKAARMKKTDPTLISKSSTNEISPEMMHETLKTPPLITINGFKTSVTLDEQSNVGLSPSEQSTFNSSLEPLGSASSTVG